MFIRCWGSRGSVPVSGEAYKKYGGDTTCIEVRAEDTIIIIDAGSGMRRLGKVLHQENLQQVHIFLTHQGNGFAGMSVCDRPAGDSAKESSRGVVFRVQQFVDCVAVFIQRRCLVVYQQAS